MTKRVLIISSVLSLLVTVLFSSLYLHQGYWKNWDKKKAYIEFFNQGDNGNSLMFDNASKSVKVTYPEVLKNVVDLDKSGQGMLMTYKVGIFNRQQSVTFKTIGDGRLIINFQPQHKKFARDSHLRTGQIKISDPKLGFKKLPSESRFVKEVKDNEQFILSFRAKNVFCFWEILCHIDWLMFIITLFLSFFVSFLGVRYLSHFKINKKASRIDIIFLASFFIFLLLPLSHIEHILPCMTQCLRTENN